jgi:hypothetical protein
MKYCLLFLLAFMSSSRQTIIAQAQPSPRNYNFGNGVIEEQVLRNYLSRAISLTEFCNSDGFYTDIDYPFKEDDVRMLKHIGAKFIGRSAYSWGSEHRFQDPRYWKAVTNNIQQMHAYDPQMVFQACIFEIITRQVNQVAIPAWVFTAFNEPVTQRNFEYDSMLNPGGALVNHWGNNSSVPDIARPEAQKWCYFLSRKFIDAGIEAIHFGQVELMAMTDRKVGYRNWEMVLQRTRDYAKAHARRKMILCDAHVPGGGLGVNGKLLLDFHSFPLRPKETPDKPGQAILEKNYLDAIYGKSQGGITPSGWRCEHLPYLAEFDNFGVSDRPGKPGINSYFVWGYDEITWFSLQPEDYRNEWIRYAWNWVRNTDKDGYVQMPGRRIATPGTPDRKRYNYRVNTNSPACPPGFSQENTIQQVWAADR